MKPYPSYKDSGVEWIGKIPEYWDMLKYKRMSTFKNGMNFSAQDKGQGVLTLDVLNMYDGDSLYIKDFELYRVNKDNISDYYLKEGDLLFVRSSLKREGVGWCSLFKPLNEQVSYCGFLIRARPMSLSYNPKFLAYYFRSNSGRNEVIANSNTVTITNIGQSPLGEVKIPLPPLPDQKQIVSFLDHKTQKIDELIEKTEKKIELLKEKRTSLINHCVTKGLNGLDGNACVEPAETKDSGVEWIGEIPKHWEVKKLKYCDSVIMGQSPSSEDYNDEMIGLPFLQGNADFSLLYPQPRIWCDKANKIADTNDILLSVRAPIGSVNIANQQFGIGRGLCAIRSKSTCGRLLYYFALSINDELNSIGTGSTYTAVSIDDIENIYIPQFPLHEQHKIVEYLDEQTKKINSTIKKETQRIDLLKEYRKSLISEVVTGKIDVRDWNS